MTIYPTHQQAKLDAWLFPFMNVYATISKFEGDGTIPLAIRGSDLLDFLGFDGLCNGGVFEPELCTRTLSAVAKPQYNGKNIVLGTILAMGWSFQAELGFGGSRSNAIASVAYRW